MQWKRLTRLNDLSVLDDPRYADLGGRLRCHDELDQSLTDYCATRPAAELQASLRQHGIPTATVSIGTGATEHPQLVARDRVHEITHPVVGSARYIGLPMRFSPVALRPALRPAPLLGQDNDAVLTELGFSPSGIEVLLADEVIASTPG